MNRGFIGEKRLHHCIGFAHMGPQAMSVAVCYSFAPSCDRPAY